MPQSSNSSGMPIAELSNAQLRASAPDLTPLSRYRFYRISFCAGDQTSMTEHMGAAWKAHTAYRSTKQPRLTKSSVRVQMFGMSLTLKLYPIQIETRVTVSVRV